MLISFLVKIVDISSVWYVSVQEMSLIIGSFKTVSVRQAKKLHCGQWGQRKGTVISCYQLCLM